MIRSFFCSSRVWYSHATIFGVQHLQTDRQTDRQMYQVNGNCAMQSDSSVTLPFYQTTRRHIPEGHKILTCAVFRISDSLRSGRSGDRIPVQARFSAPVQTGPGAHPASYTRGTGSFLGVNRPGCGVDHQPLSSTEVKQRVQLYLYFPWAFIPCSRVTFTFRISAMVRSPTSALSRHIYLLVCVLPHLVLQTLTSCSLDKCMEQSPS
jgi:hypothetical protein